MIGKTQPQDARSDALENDAEYLADFKRSEPVSRRIREERVLDLARNARRLGRRSLTHLMLGLQRAARRRPRRD